MILEEIQWKRYTDKDNLSKKKISLLENILYSKVFSLKLMQTPIAIKSIKK